MSIALIRPPGPAFERCALTHVERLPIDLAHALAQHAGYAEVLRGLGLEVTLLPAQDDAPDACFVEDPAFVLPEVAVLGRPALESRRAEVESVAAALAPHRELLRLEAPCTLEGGDVLAVDDTVYVGWSGRTNHAGLKALAHALLPYGYRVKAIEVQGCLHLKTALTRVGPRTLLANRGWVHTGRVDGFEILDVDAAEPFAANGVLIGERFVYPTGFPRTEALLRAHGVDLRLVELSELQKAEAGPSCLSLIVETD